MSRSTSGNEQTQETTGGPQDDRCLISGLSHRTVDTGNVRLMEDDERINKVQGSIDTRSGNGFGTDTGEGRPGCPLREGEER